MNAIGWLLLLPSGLYTDGKVSSTTPLLISPPYSSGLTLEECVKMQLSHGGQCVGQAVRR